MAFIKIDKVAVRGMAACVPEHIEENIDLPFFKDGEAERVIAQTGIERKHTVGEGDFTTADLCEKACNELIEKLGWERDSIDAIVFVCSVGDYILPPSSCLLQDRLGLSESCLAIDIKQGCPGWVIGMSTATALVATGSIKRAILMNGDLNSLLNSRRDKETAPIFGDAGAATALEYDENAPTMYFYHGTRGKDFKFAYIPEGGHRNKLTPESLEYKEIRPNVLRRGIDTIMDGMGVFAFGLNVGPKLIKCPCEHYGLNMDEVDFFVFHQANKYLIDKIRKKLKIEPERVPYCIKDFGNTGNCCVPLTLVSQCNEEMNNKKLKIMGCAFGVGMAWSSVYFETDKIVCPQLLLYK
ncbi:3-oxoacyl-ACP synthase III family protein [Prevotella sp. tf2-5]|uniref:3-oxoacyl-ACP synthase III family protein n=1 Tax=Prevotella sp. tf2-5 TaxID=1761889 RepID=UPI0008E71DCF|nr:ketoacyl-ACP synthase III [Prevotella sp. tf2-5]SFP02602.1 3-oxoacyl-[acyl-carrier-protein] synthase-3 [Prevotella sp. tf2-5]